jgi:uroporphyrinogen decarboxylase
LIEEKENPSVETSSPQLPTKRFLAPFQGLATKAPPIWLMRQAGRYLPEYREVRGIAGGFLNLCYNPKLAAEVTLQPIRRYGFDAAILFSDILVVPDALGQKVEFLEGEGPKLEPIRDAKALAKLDPVNAGRKYDIIADSVARIRAGLSDESALIGFCGAPWTVATYMINGKGSTEQAATRLFAYRERATFQRLIDTLVATSIDYLDRQIKAGADVIQIFDSWAGTLPEHEFDQWVIEPNMAIVAGLKKLHPTTPVIGFPRGAAASKAKSFRDRTGIDGIGCDTAMPLSDMVALSKDGHVVQGNLDPLLLVAGGQPLINRTREIIDALEGRPFIFNLGHGIVPETPPDHVAQLVKLVRAAGA